jgi:hypothetical protein
VPHTLDALSRIGPKALAALYAEGSAPEATWLGERVSGRILSSGAPSLVDRLVRPFMRAYGRLGAFEGKSFAADGASGANRILGSDRLPFRCARVDSILDQRPTLKLDYDLPSNGPLRPMFDELRRIDDAIAIGPAMLRLPIGKPPIMFWFGVEAR